MGVSLHVGALEADKADVDGDNNGNNCGNCGNVGGHVQPRYLSAPLPPIALPLLPCLNSLARNAARKNR